MNIEPRVIAAAESYPTFWDTTPPLPPAHPVPADEAYSRFVSLTEDEFPDDADTSTPDADPDAE